MTKVYVVDDNKTVREFYATLFDRFGYEVSQFEEGESLLEKSVSEGAPDLVFMDTEMPGRKGYEIGKELKARFPNIKIIGASGRDYKQNWEEAGADAYFSKPFNVVNIIETVKKLLKENEKPI